MSTLSKAAGIYTVLFFGGVGDVWLFIIPLLVVLYLIGAI